MLTDRVLPNRVIQQSHVAVHTEVILSNKSQTKMASQSITNGAAPDLVLCTLEGCFIFMSSYMNM